MEPRTRTRALTAAAVALTAGFTLATTCLPSSAHAADPAGRARPTAEQSTPLVAASRFADAVHLPWSS